MKTRKITQIIGTGGIGKGLFFRSYENTTLGRNESRMVELSKAKDYCKLHIVFHYVARFLASEIKVVPIGKIGKDAYGMQCWTQMKEVGMEMKWVEESNVLPTMLSVCLQYPDKNGCNITANNSACGEVDKLYIRKAIHEMEINQSTIAVALPEVALESRIELLRCARKQGALCVAACNTAEIDEFVRLGGPELCDIIALNQEEAAAFAKIKNIEEVVDAKQAADKILEKYPHLCLWITLGKKGSLLSDRNHMCIYPSVTEIQVKNTGGAGDASLAGLLIGYCLGLPLCEHEEGMSEFRDAGELAVLMAGMSVESADSINEEITWARLQERANRMGKKIIKMEK